MRSGRHTYTQHASFNSQFKEQWCVLPKCPATCMHACTTAWPPIRPCVHACMHARAGFRMSRSKMTDMIKGGDVRVNWRPASKTSQDVKAGDVISVRGKGRLTVQSVNPTKKDRFAVTMLRYV